MLLQALHQAGELENLLPVVILMRLLLEILIAAGLVALAWDTSYYERIGTLVPALASTHQASPNSATEPARRSPAPQSANTTPPPEGSPTPSGAWMWDPKRQGSLDRTGQSSPPNSFTGHIYYTDENGKKYWLDAQGQRHYDH